MGLKKKGFKQDISTFEITQKRDLGTADRNLKKNYIYKFSEKSHLLLCHSKVTQSSLFDFCLVFFFLAI